jgi:hypothetical protein
MRRSALVLLTLASLAASAPARAEAPPSKQEESRKKLLKELGLKKTDAPVPPAETAPTPAVPPTTPEEPAPKTPGRAPETKPAERRSPAPSFQRAIHPILMSTCGAACHRAGGPAMATRLVLTGDARADHAAVARLVDVHAPPASRLLTKVSGAEPHGGGPLWPEGNPAREKLLQWIQRGAPLDAPATPEPKAEPAPEAQASAPPSRTRGHGAPVPAAPAVAEPVPGEPAAAPAAPAPAPAAPSPPRAAQAPAVHPILMSACAVCHRAGGPAAATRLVLTGDAVADEAAARALVDPRAPEQSLLLAKASGTVMHAGGPVLPTADPRYAVLLAWAAPLAPAPGPAPIAPVAVAAPIAPPVPAAAPPSHHGLQPGGVQLPLGFFLDGRFDLAYERRTFNGDPFADGSVAALRSYHHFLFLSREAGGPCGLSLEVLTLLFWEAHCRIPGLPGPLHVNVAGGKIVVPFGADPLFHQSYGGLEGFDQPILPAVWSIEGVAAHVVVPHGKLAFSDDLYVVRGYALARADAVLNLQNDFSATDTAELGWGNRLGVAWLGLSAWYSAYFNPLGFGRHLFMQAVDVMVARPRAIPVLGHFSAAAGFLRADVSGGGPGVGGPGLDYYDFGSYFQLRYHPTDWLYVQYREGLRTFDNRRGVILDNSRLTSADASTHNFGVVARCGGLSGGVFYFVNLEKVNEIPNDLLRVSVAYDF